jgi:hypothetical protein
VSSLIIVESHNDKFFVEKIIEVLGIAKNISVDEPICNPYDFECLDGLTNLGHKLNEVKTRVDKYEKIGIILDADDKEIVGRIEFINGYLTGICSDVHLTQINQFVKSAELKVEIGCYIMNVDGSGELDTVLKAIKNKESIYADCLESWKECLGQKGKEITKKDFDKFWVSNYLRFDTCSKKEQKQADKKCKSEVAIKKDIWNFGHPALDDLKAFLLQLA